METTTIIANKEEEDSNVVDNTIRLRTAPDTQTQNVVESELVYGKPDRNEGLYRDVQTQQPNFAMEKRTVEIHDVRGREKEFSFDKNGFQFVEHETSEELLETLSRTAGEDEAAQKRYFAEIEALLKDLTGASAVYCFQCAVRARLPNGERPKLPLRPPAEHVHCDNSPNCIPRRLERFFTDPEEYQRVLKGRYQTINVWRPLIDHVEDWPLAVCDHRSIDKEDEIDVTIFVKTTNEQYKSPSLQLRYNPEHKWHFWSKQRKDELICFKCYDSRMDVARYTAHTAFQNPQAVEGATPRKSVEIRAIAVYPPEE